MMRINPQAFVQIVANLRQQFPEETKDATDTEIYTAYEAFSQSDEFGNNNEKFPEWLAQYTDEGEGE